MNDVSKMPDGDVGVSIASLHVYPIKSCGGIALTDVMVIETGFEFDRAWMVVDPDGRLVTQRELPRMALIGTTVGPAALELRSFPNFVSTKLTAARTFQGTLNLRSASR